jgi:hypothetical protein
MNTILKATLLAAAAALALATAVPASAGLIAPVDYSFVKAFMDSNGMYFQFGSTDLGGFHLDGSRNAAHELLNCFEAMHGGGRLIKMGSQLAPEQVAHRLDQQAAERDAPPTRTKAKRPKMGAVEL